MAKKFSAARMPPWYPAGMDADGITPWGLILLMFAYSFVGWAALFAIHYRLRKRRIEAPTAQHAAIGYGESWKSTRVSEV